MNCELYNTLFESCQQQKQDLRKCIYVLEAWTRCIYEN